MITALAATELARQIRERRLSPVDVVEAHITRIEAINPAVNALVTPMFAQARRDAYAAAQAIELGAPLGPLHGVPFTAKDSIDAAGARVTIGLTACAERRAIRDAPIVARLRAAGAILLGKTNLPDACWSQETENLLFGRTNNPWNLRRSVGGSTGGEAALIAAGGSPLGLGSDIAGSIRLPAHFTGIVGLRPTSATLPEQGQWPPFVGRLADLESVGPMARRVEDVALAFDILRGTSPTALDLDRLRDAPLASWFDDGLIPSSQAVKAAVRAASDALLQKGMRPVIGAPRARRLAAIGWSAYLDTTSRRMIAVGMGGGAARSLPLELLYALSGRARISPNVLLYWTAAHLISSLANLRINGAAWRERLRNQLHGLIGDHGIAICPIFPTSAPRHGWIWGTMLLTLGYQAWVNLAGLPGLTIPIGSTGRGMPIGVQIVGMPHTEHTILAAGLAIQQALMPEWRGPTI